MLARYRDNERHQDYRASVIALPIINRYRGENDRMRHEDLFSSLKPKQEVTGPKQHANAFAAWAAAGFGKIQKMDT